MEKQPKKRGRGRPKLEHPKKMISPRIGIDSHNFYDNWIGKLHTGVAYVMDSFPAIYRLTLVDELRGVFRRNEILAILDVANTGDRFEPALAGRILTGMISRALSTNGLASKWDIDPVRFSAKLESLTYGQVMVLEAWAQAFWSSPEHENDNFVERWISELL